MKRGARIDGGQGTKRFLKTDSEGAARNVMIWRTENPRNLAGALVVVGFLTMLAPGCSDNGLVPVSGQVTLDGNPVSAGRIEFFPETGRPAVGDLDGEGRYQLTTTEPGDGAKLGTYVVTVTAREESADGPQYQSMEDELNGVLLNSEKESAQSAVKWIVPPKYANRATSGLNAEVDGSGDIDFGLQSHRNSPSN